MTKEQVQEQKRLKSMTLEQLNAYIEERRGCENPWRRKCTCEETDGELCKDCLNAFGKYDELNDAMRERARRQKLEQEKRHTQMLALATNIVNAGYRESAKKAHPDVGGSADQMHELQAAKEWLLLQINKKASQPA